MGARCFVLTGNEKVTWCTLTLNLTVLHCVNAVAKCGNWTVSKQDIGVSLLRQQAIHEAVGRYHRCHTPKEASTLPCFGTTTNLGDGEKVLDFANLSKCCSAQGLVS